MSQSLQVLVVSKGHAFNHDSFIAMFEAMDGVQMTLVEQPAAQVVLQPEHIEPYDAVFFYDMSGIPGAGLLHDGAEAEGQPPPAYRRAIEGLLEAGKGLVLVNHATVSWPRWPLWRRITGSSFMLTAGELDGVAVPGSGYRGGHGPLPNATIRLLPQQTHPVLAGLEDGRNRGPGVDSKERFIYIHGTPDESSIGTPASHGCVRMRNADVIDLFDRIDVGTLVEIDG